MIKNLGKLFLTLCLLTVGGGVVANAQIDTDNPIQANVPFAFAIGNTQLPAGKYQIKKLDDLAPNVLELSSENGHTKVVFETEDAETRADQPASKTELVFDKVGDQYFLARIWVAGSLSGIEMPKSRMEKRLTDGGSRPEKHSIVALLKRVKR